MWPQIHTFYIIYKKTISDLYESMRSCASNTGNTGIPFFKYQNTGIRLGLFWWFGSSLCIRVSHQTRHIVRLIERNIEEGFPSQHGWQLCKLFIKWKSSNGHLIQIVLKYDSVQYVKVTKNLALFEDEETRDKNFRSFCNYFKNVQPTYEWVGTLIFSMWKLCIKITYLLII